MAFGTYQFDDLAGGRARLKEMFHGSHDIVEKYDLELPGVRHDRNDREGGQTAHEGACSERGAPDHHGRAQDDPIEVALHQRVVAGKLCPGKRAGGFPVHADCGEVNDPADPQLLTSSEQARNA